MLLAELQLLKEKLSNWRSVWWTLEIEWCLSHSKISHQITDNVITDLSSLLTVHRIQKDPGMIFFCGN